LFVASISAFIAGIYLGAVQNYTIAYVVISLCILLFLLPFFFRYDLDRLSVIALLIAFFLTGILRVSLAVPEESPVPDIITNTYSGTVVESSRATKVIKLDSPVALNGTRAIIRSEQHAGIGDNIIAAGTLKELTSNFKNPGRISWKWIKRREGTFYEIGGDIISIHQAPGILERIRRYCAEKIDASGAAHTGVIKALTIGDTTGLNDTTKDLFLQTGTSHILSISGSHFAVITGIVFFIVTFLLRFNLRSRQKGTDRQYAALITIPFAIAFMFISGSSLPTVRATITIVVYMLAIIFDRSRHIENGLFLSALAILTIYPFSLFSPSFQLTFICVLFIILVSKACGQRLARLPGFLRWLLSMILITITTTAGTLPVVLYHFYGFNPLSAIHNLISIPLLCIIATPLSLVGIIAPFGDYILGLSGSIIGFTIAILDKINWGYIYPVIRPSLSEAIVYLIAAVSLLYFKRKIVRFAFFALILPVVFVTTGIACHSRFNNKDLCISYIDVGLGDAMLVEATHGVRLLIDGGGFYGSNFDIGRSVIGPFLLAKKVVTLDYVINTHPHQDHLAGLQHVLQYFNVRNFAAGMGGPGPGNIQNILSIRKIPLSLMQTGDGLRIGDVDIQVFHSYFSPDRNINDSSLVLRIRYGDMSFLLTGDIGEDIERSLIMRGADVRSSVLKIPHHGSRFSSTAEFIRAVRPQVGILSVGPGVKGIPSNEAVARFKAYNVPVYRTDRHGCIRVCTDGKKLTIHTESR